MTLTESTNIQVNLINNLGCLRRELVKSKVTNSKKRMTEPAVSEFKVHKLLKADDSKAPTGKSINNISYMRCTPCLLPDLCLPGADCAFHCRKRCCDIYFR